MPLIIRRVTRNALRRGGVLLIALLTGCAGSTSYRLGKDQMAAGRYDEAVVLLRRAVADAPDNRQYLRTLDLAESRAAEQHFARADQLWRMNQAWLARDELRQVFANVPAHPQAMRLNESVEQRIAEVDHLTQQSKAQLEAGDPDTAGVLARQAYTLDTSHPDARSLAIELSIIEQVPLSADESPPDLADASASQAPENPAPPIEPVSVAPATPTTPEETPPQTGEREEVSASEAPVRIARIVLSRDDDRYRKRQPVTDGILIELDDTDEHPLDADLEFRVGREKFKHKNQRVGAQIPVTGASGRKYSVVIIAIVDKHETVVMDLISHPPHDDR